MSLEVACPNCSVRLVAEKTRFSCYACGQKIEVALPSNGEDERRLAEPVVRFLRGLLFDGELSGEEVWCLANWLNQRPREICDAWPANILIPLLKTVFDDGELTEVEMLQVATTLVQIERDWTSRYAVIEQADNPPIPPVTSDMVTRPLLPVVDHIEDVESFSGDGVYRVDLATHRCTCGDWVGARRMAPPQDFKRLCKHMAELYYKMEIARSLGDSLFGAFIEDYFERQRGTFPRDDWTLETVNGKRILYGHSPGNPWVNIFAPRGASYERFGFNKEEKRWSYGESPAGVCQNCSREIQGRMSGGIRSVGAQSQIVSFITSIRRAFTFSLSHQTSQWLLCGFGEILVCKSRTQKRL